MIVDRDCVAGHIESVLLRRSLKHTQLVELGENILNIRLNIRRRQPIRSGKGAHDLVKRILPIAELPDLSGRLIDHMGLAIAAIVEDSLLPDSLERNILLRGGRP
jgi:hypothetical protein